MLKICLHPYLLLLNSILSLLFILLVKWEEFNQPLIVPSNLGVKFVSKLFHLTRFITIPHHLTDLCLHVLTQEILEILVFDIIV